MLQSAKKHAKLGASKLADLSVEHAKCGAQVFFVLFFPLMDESHVLAAVKKLRREVLKLKQLEFAQLLGVSLRSVTRLENEAISDRGMLHKLVALSLNHGDDELAAVFMGAIQKELGIESIMDLNKPSVQLYALERQASQAVTALRKATGKTDQDQAFIDEGKDRARHIESVLKKLREEGER